MNRKPNLIVDEKVQCNERLLGTPHPIHGESVSSWLLRVGCHHRIAPTDLLEMIGCRSRMYELDFGERSPVSELVGLAQLTGVPVEALMAPRVEIPTRHVSMYNDYLWRRLPSQIEPQRFCTVCLEHDQVPHFRAHWRLATVLMCDAHGVALRSRCHNCNRIIGAAQARTFVRQIDDRRHVARFCPGCRISLGEACAPKLSKRGRQVLDILSDEMPRLWRCGEASGWSVPGATRNKKFLQNLCDTVAPSGLEKHYLQMLTQVCAELYDGKRTDVSGNTVKNASICESNQ